MKVREILNRNRKYILMLVFILLFNLFVAPAKKGPQELFIDKVSDMEKRIKEHIISPEGAKEKIILIIAGGMGAVILLVGTILSIFFMVFKLQRKEVFPELHKPIPPGWVVQDIVKVAIIIISLSYLIAIVEQLLFPCIFVFNESAMMIFNITVVDFIGISVCLWFVGRKYKQGLSSLGIFREGLGKGVWYGALGYVGFIPVFIGIMLIMHRIFSIFQYAPTHQPIFKFFFEAPFDSYLIYLFLFVGLLGPVMEEIFFRGFVYTALRSRFGIPRGILISAIIFAALHMNIGAFFPILALGILLSYIYEKTGTLISSITMHILHNSLVLGLVIVARMV